MGKRIFSIILAIFLLLSVPVSTSAYEITGFSVTAKSALLVSLDTGEVLYSRDPDIKAYPASITKIMTAIVILESGSYNAEGRITMTDEIQNLVLGTGLSVSNLKAGEEFSQNDLMHLIIMSSYGDCAYLAAQIYGGDIPSFVAMMNEKAKKLGMTDTCYGNPVGMHDESTYTTAQDVYTLASYAIKNEVFKEISAKSRYTMPATNKSAERTLSTTVMLQDNTTDYYYQYAKGIKTGFTDEAGRCLVSTASYNGYNYMCVLMGCPNDYQHRYEFTESRNLYRWAFNNFEYKEIADGVEPVTEMPVTLSWDVDYVPLYIEKSFVTILPDEADTSTVTMEYHLKSESVEPPVKKGTIMGTADVIYAESVIGTVNLIAGNDVKASKILIALKYVGDFFTSAVLKAIGLCAVAIVVIFILAVILMNIGRGRKRKVKYIPYGKDKK